MAADITDASRSSTYEPDASSSSLVSRTASALWKVLPAAIFIVLLCTVLELLVDLGVVSDVLLAKPSSVAAKIWDLGHESFFWTATQVTVEEALLGFVTGSLAGLVIGVLSANYQLFNRVIYPWVILLQNTPRVALAPIFLTWLGFGMTSKVVTSATICFFPLVINTIVGLNSTDGNSQLMLRSLGASKAQIFRYLTFPTALPVVFAGLKNAITLSLIGAIVAEFVGATHGMGILIQQYQSQLDVAGGFAVVLVLGIVGLILYAIVAWIDKKLIFWQGK